MADPYPPFWMIVLLHPVQSLREAFRVNLSKRN